MEFIDFAKKIQNSLKKKLGKEYTVEIKKVQKNNGVILYGLFILSEKQSIFPTIYLESFWEAYRHGMSLSKIVNQILELFYRDMPRQRVDMNFFKNFENVKDRICCRLINRGKNEKLLKDIPYMEYLDLAVCFYYAYQSEELGRGSILIYHNHVEMWNTSVSELKELAEKNTPKFFPWECSFLEELIQSSIDKRKKQGEIMSEAEEQKQVLEDFPMLVLGNKYHTHGAAALFYPEILHKISEQLNSNYFILPSSIHELILLPDTGRENIDTLHNMIIEVNLTQVDAEEVLSDNLYYYDRSKREVRIIL